MGWKADSSGTLLLDDFVLYLLCQAIEVTRTRHVASPMVILHTSSTVGSILQVRSQHFPAERVVSQSIISESAHRSSRFSLCGFDTGTKLHLIKVAYSCMCIDLLLAEQLNTNIWAN